MNEEGADRFVAHARPARFKGARAHVIVAGHHGGGEKERVFQRDAAQFALKPLFILRERRFTFQLHLVVQPVHEIPNRHLRRSHTGPFAGRGAGDARVLFREALYRRLLGAKPDAPEQGGGLHFFTGCVTGGVCAQRAADHICPGDNRDRSQHIKNLLNQCVMVVVR